MIIKIRWNHCKDVKQCGELHREDRIVHNNSSSKKLIKIFVIFKTSLYWLIINEWFLNDRPNNPIFILYFHANHSPLMMTKKLWASKVDVRLEIVKSSAQPNFFSRIKNNMHVACMALRGNACYARIFPVAG